LEGLTMSHEEFIFTVAAQEEYEHTVRPSIPLTSSKFIYRNAANTNVQETWKRFGWQPKKLPTIEEVTKAALEVLEQEIKNANQR